MVIDLSASTLRAMLAFIDPQGGPMIAAANDSLAEPLVKKIRATAADCYGSEVVRISFAPEERELAEEFLAVAKNITSVFCSLASVAASLLGVKI